MHVLESYRREEGLSYEELGRQLHASRARMWEWCCGNRPVPPLRVLEFSRVTGIPPHLLRPDMYEPPDGAPAAAAASRRRPAPDPAPPDGGGMDW